MIEGLKPYPAYKASTSPWLGEIPDHWTEKRAKCFYREVDERSTTGKEELMSVSHKTGVTPRKAHVTMFMAESNAGHKICRPNDVVINTMWAFMAALGVAKQVGVVSPSYGVYRPRCPGELHPHFVDQLLRVESYKAEYFTRSTGINSSRLRLYPDQFLRIPIICPPPQEQMAIVRFLNHADRRIWRYVGAKRRLIALLNEQKQAIIHRAVTRGLDPSVRLKPSGIDWLGDVPEHWCVGRLKTFLLRIDQGISPQAEARLAEDGSWGVLKSGCVNRGIFRDTEHKRLPDGFAFDPDLEVKQGDVLVSRACGSPALVGSVARVEQLRHHLILSDKTFRLIFREPHLIAFFVAVMQTPIYKNQVRQAISGAEGLANNLPLTSLRDFICIAPPLLEADRIAQYIEKEIHNIVVAIQNAEREIGLITELRTCLVSDVVTGKLDVREVASPLLMGINEQDVSDEADALIDGDELTDHEDLDAEPAEVEA